MSWIISLKYHIRWNFSGTNHVDYIDCEDTDLTVQVFPVVLCHEPEERQKCPAKGVKAGVAIVRITRCFHTVKTIWTFPVEKNAVVIEKKFSG